MSACHACIIKFSCLECFFVFLFFLLFHAPHQILSGSLFLTEPSLHPVCSATWWAFFFFVWQHQLYRVPSPKRGWKALYCLPSIRNVRLFLSGGKFAVFQGGVLKESFETVNVVVCYLGVRLFCKLPWITVVCGKGSIENILVMKLGGIQWCILLGVDSGWKNKNFYSNL